MSDVATDPKPRARRGWLALAAFVAVDFVLGAAAGVYAGVFFGPSLAPTETAIPDASGHVPEPAKADKGIRHEIDVGRIAVVIPAAGGSGGKLHLLITPLVVGHGGEGTAKGAGDGGPVGPTAELRDAFIEYLSQLHDVELRGSLGLVTLRAELLRRARAVAPDLNASAVLIQEFVIQ
jgi:hypothetical protein